MRSAAGVGVAVMSDVFTSRWLPSMSNVSVAPSVRTSIVTGAQPYFVSLKRLPRFTIFPSLALTVSVSPSLRVGA